MREKRGNKRKEEWITKATSKLKKNHVLPHKKAMSKTILMIPRKFGFEAQSKPHTPPQRGGLTHMLVSGIHMPTVFSFSFTLVLGLSLIMHFTRVINNNYKFFFLICP